MQGTKLLGSSRAHVPMRPNYSIIMAGLALASAESRLRGAAQEGEKGSGGLGLLGSASGLDAACGIRLR